MPYHNWIQPPLTTGIGRGRGVRGERGGEWGERLGGGGDRWVDGVGVEGQRGIERG